MRRILSTALKNIRRSPYQGLMAILMMSLLFFVTYTFFMLIIGAHLMLFYFETRPQVTAFFAPKITSEEAQKVADDMQAKPYVARVNLVSKEEGLKAYQEENKKDPVLMELVTADILPVTLEVSAKSLDALPTIRDDLSKVSTITDIDYQKDVIEKLTVITRNVRFAGLTLVGVLTIISGMFVVAVLSLRIALKRKEIGIMRLLGASVWYIVSPYVAEGTMYGILGAIIGWVGMVTSLLYLTPALMMFFGSVIPLPVPFVMLLAILGGGVVIGIVMGVSASFVAARRFIRY